MQSNLLIAKNRRRQHQIELENVQKKKKRDLANSDSSEDEFLALLHRPKEKKQPKSSVNAMTLKTEKRDSSEEGSSKKRSKKRRKKNSKSTIKVEDNNDDTSPVLLDERPKIVDLALKEEFQRINNDTQTQRDRKDSEKSKKRKKGKKSPGVSSPMDVDGEARRPVKDEPVNGSEMRLPRADIIKDREERKQEQLKKNNSRVEDLRQEIETHTQDLNKIDKQIAELKGQREKHLKAIETKNEHIEKLENFNTVLHQNGYNTPFKKRSEKKIPSKRTFETKNTNDFHFIR